MESEPAIRAFAIGRLNRHGALKPQAREGQDDKSDEGSATESSDPAECLRSWQGIPRPAVNAHRFPYYITNRRACTGPLPTAGGPGGCRARENPPRVLPPSGEADPMRPRRIAAVRGTPVLVATGLLAASCGGAPTDERAAEWRTTDELGEEFAQLALELAEHDPLFLDYRFPDGPALAGEPAPLRDLERRAARLAARAGSLPRDADEGRLRYLAAAADALLVRVRSLLGERLPAAEELRRVFGLDWQMPEFDLERLHFRVERAIPGLAPLRVRVSRHYRSGEIAGDDARREVGRALADCRALAPPPDSTLALEPLAVEWLTREAAAGVRTGASPFYRYLGGGRGALRLPGWRPYRAGELRRLACHEGVPGHHLQAAAAEARFRETGWPELGIVPLYGPRTAVFEGLAAMAETLAPSDPAEEALRALEPVVASILFDYLDGGRTRLSALRALDFEALVSDPHALLVHADRFGVYSLVRPSADPEFRRALEAVIGPTRPPGERWDAVRRAAAKALTPDDLARLQMGLAPR